MLYTLVGVDALKNLTDAMERVTNHGLDKSRRYNEAVAEIERLRASQFRWIPVGDLQKLPVRSLVAYPEDSVASVQGAGGLMAGASYYLPIPPLPEKSQKDRDHEGWAEVVRANIAGWTQEQVDAAYKAYFAGLKAARSQQPT